MAHAEVSKADAFKLFAKNGITVRVPELTKRGERAKDADGNFKALDRSLAAEDILDAREVGDEVVMVTCDGQRHRAAKPAGK